MGVELIAMVLILGLFVFTVTVGWDFVEKLFLPRRSPNFALMADLEHETWGDREHSNNVIDAACLRCHPKTHAITNTPYTADRSLGRAWTDEELADVEMLRGMTVEDYAWNRLRLLGMDGGEYQTQLEEANKLSAEYVQQLREQEQKLKEAQWWSK